MKPIKATIFGVAAILMSFSLGVGVWLFQEEEYLRIKSPCGRYIAVVTIKRYEAFIPKKPGQGSDKSGYIAIEDTSGVQYGKLPLPLVWMADSMMWNQEGAVLIGAGTWNFSSGECELWE